ncbi:MAG: hypothetical protein K0S41_1478 [Anaerocolumna sp.]|jgi:hypothetical protein|nr:hypothetical protein [Anaerocolumna sp.]
MIKEDNMHSAKILDNNYNSIEGSFIYYLHEESKFDKVSFWKYYNCLREIALQSINKGIDRDVSIKINVTYRFILESILYHFAPDDLYRIKNFPRKKYNLYLERLRYAVDGYFSGYIMDESAFGNELKNPIA